MTENRFNTVGVLCRPNTKTILPTIASLVDVISALGSELIFDHSTIEDLDLPDIQKADRNKIGKSCDLLIIVGGDGTLLDAARAMSQYQIPMIGVNLGRLGFLVDISPADIAKIIPQIFAGDYITESRIMLELEVRNDDKVILNAPALNDIVIHKSNVARMIEFEVLIDDSFVYTQRSDGLIVATPTGSTAYSLSGGGPILHPSLEAVSLVPICPHTLSNRPIAVAASAEIIVRAIEGPFENFRVSCDGQINHLVSDSEFVTIRMHQNRLQLLHPSNYDYYQLLRAKLNWATQHLPDVKR